MKKQTPPLKKKLVQPVGLPKTKLDPCFFFIIRRPYLEKYPLNTTEFLSLSHF